MGTIPVPTLPVDSATSCSIQEPSAAIWIGMNVNAVKQAFHRLRLQFRETLREEIAHTVATPDEVEDELRHLIAVLRT